MRADCARSSPDDCASMRQSTSSASLDANSLAIGTFDRSRAVIMTRGAFGPSLIALSATDRSSKSSRSKPSATINSCRSEVSKSCLKLSELTGPNGSPHTFTARPERAEQTFNTAFRAFDFPKPGGAQTTINWAPFSKRPIKSLCSMVPSSIVWQLSLRELGSPANRIHLNLVIHMAPPPF